MLAFKCFLLLYNTSKILNNIILVIEMQLLSCKSYCHKLFQLCTFCHLRHQVFALALASSNLLTCLYLVVSYSNNNT